MQRINNRGTGAGGAQTNANGLPYEILTSLDTEFTVTRNINKHTRIVLFNGYNGNFVHTNAEWVKNLHETKKSNKR